MSGERHGTQNGGFIATIGTFDGVHTGHRYLLEELKNHGRRLGLDPVAIVLDTHPLEIVRPQAAPPQLSTFEERRGAIEARGVRVIRLRFTPRSRTDTSEAFMRKMHDEMGVKALLVGHDNRFGSDRQNGPEHYLECGKSIGIEVIVASCLPGVSSSAVRRLLAAGEIEEGNRLLGYPYGVGGTVVGGARLGRTLGFPTANLKPAHPCALIPPTGVYATCASVDETGRFWPAMTNIGHRPTVAGPDAPLSIETHLFDYEGDLYGRPMRLLFATCLRDERRFDSPEALREQLTRDAEAARAALKRLHLENPKI